MSEQKQEHAGFSVEMLSSAEPKSVRVHVRGCAVRVDGDAAYLDMRDLESARALRDALSAFIAFHGGKRSRNVVDDSFDHCE
jgi:hypothetical protein